MSRLAFQHHKLDLLSQQYCLPHMTLQCQDMLCLTSCAGEQLVSTAQLSTRLKHFGKGQIGKPLGLWHVIPVSKNSQATQSWHAFSE